VCQAHIPEDDELGDKHRESAAESAAVLQRMRRAAKSAAVL
jgi:hypothetical protein